MFRRSIPLAAALALMSVVAAEPTQAQGVGPSPFGFGFQPFGFYQPYGATYGTSLRTPPYFATNPPVYYGARHARPYGLSPFASPPLASAGANYHSRLRSDFIEPRVGTPGPAPRSIYLPPHGCNAYSHQSPSSGIATAAAPTGPIRSNPFVEDEAKLAKN